jgi:RNA polymerase sigma-70 factor (ECF subfamily)
MSEMRLRFERTALPFLQALYQLALRLTRNASDSNDLVQDTYLRAYQKFSSFSEGTNCKSWLFTIMYSIFVNRYRRKQREPVLMSPDDLEKQFADSFSVDPESQYSASLESSEIEAALVQLPEIFRTPVVLIDLEGFTYEEAAQVLDCPIGTVRSRLFRARKMLYLTLKEYARKHGYERNH